jgi:phosphopantetheine adenylyltransferase
MTEIQVNVTEEQVRAGIEKCLTEALKSSYSNPVNDAVVKALKEQEGVIKKFVDELIANAIANPEFKTKLGEIVLGKMIELALKK